ncbi:multicomponent Na+/H+ antiporter subunit E [Desulfotignum phosphitoxidans DSM 13687]|uniref:Multicomponent Na+/H+ antiporter subunit E n=2 Tax=Desulfotignum phosphitoxidans TaxID=190898 RepID=S0G5Y0_9BACT|nr:multicomponent Na+/H+ antiporter subunit E [Desulfotignum phosphitoxidans DSM 13687]
MPLLILNIFFAAVFTLLLGSTRISAFIAGFFIGYIILWVSRPLYPDTRYFRKLPKTINLVLYFFKELVISSFRVTWDVITPSHISRPGIIGVPLSARTDLEIFLVSNLLSLTPGTLSVDLSEDRHTLFVHVMFLEDGDKTRQEIKNGLERRVLEVMR